MSDHPIINPEVLKAIFEQYKDSSRMIPLGEYLRVGPKPRGTDSKTGLNSHYEVMLTRKELGQEHLDGSQFVALDRLGNANQVIYAMVHGYNPNKPESGFERPVVEEGPHMIIGVYAIDQAGHLHIFRTLQMRTNRLVVDTPRGFASAEMLEGGEQIYSANADEVMKNLSRVLKEEVGNLGIFNVQYLGADVVNTSFVISKSACFAVQVEYSAFMAISAILDEEEVQRRLEQFQHEGIIGGIIDMTLDQYLAYRNDFSITHDMTADRISDWIAMNHMKALLLKTRPPKSAINDDDHDDEGDDYDGEEVK